MKTGRICVVGGYGHVGIEIARLLAPAQPDRVTLAGRNKEAAERAAASIGFGTIGIELDVSRGLAPPDTALVIMCLDWQDPSFAANCLSQGVDYVDISAKGEVLGMLEGLDMKARKNEATALISVGMSPGLTNLLVARLLRDRDTPESVDIYTLLGSGDDHGPAAIEWTLDNLDAEFEVVEARRRRRVQAQRETKSTTLPGRKGRIYGARFDFPEQRALARTLSLPTVSSWMATMPPVAARAMRAATLAGVSELTRRPRSRRALMWALTREAKGNDECGAIVDVTWADGRSSKGSFVTHGQSLLTARAVFVMVEQLLEGNLPAGVHHSEGVLDADRVFGRLAELDPAAALSVTHD